MDYYEELGLKPNATAEEIRQAYRGLARLLHPDQQGDDGLRRVAEAQMKRLNTVYATLMDSARRRLYDASRVQTEALAIFSRTRAARCSWRWRDAGLLVAGMAVASVYWQLTSAPTRRADAGQTEGPAARPAADAGKTGAPLRRRQSLASLKPQARKEPVEKPAFSWRGVEPPATAADTGSAPLLRVSEPETGSPATTVIQPPALAATLPQLTGPVPRFAGTWVYVRPQVPSYQRSLYPADYIEAVIVEEAGTLHGRYRARYAVPDRPISPEVAFRFEGEVESELASLKWTGAGGAEGEVRLKLLSQDSMQLDWMATDLGTQLGLASGTAVLVRQQEPGQDRLRPPPRD